MLEMIKMIHPDAKPTGNDPPYKRLDPMRPGLKKVLSDPEEIEYCKCLHLYVYNAMCDRYELKVGA